MHEFAYDEFYVKNVVYCTCSVSHDLMLIHKYMTYRYTFITILKPTIYHLVHVCKNKNFTLNYSVPIIIQT